jgi:lysophospholipase L1-like esterase
MRTRVLERDGRSTRRRPGAGRGPARPAALVGAAALALSALALSGLPAQAATTSASASGRVTAPAYQLTLGDSLAAGYAATSPAADYASLVAAHEASHIPGLQLENLACSGATTNSMINGPGCSYPTGTQLSAAEAFLRAHVGQVPYITIDIGANNIDGCLPNGTVSISCVTNGLGLIQTQLPQILAGLHQAAPGVPIFGMDYYNPFLAAWVTGGPGGPALAHEVDALGPVLNGMLTKLYGANGAIPVDVQGVFATQDFAMTGTWNGVTVPENVARTCEWTYMCTGPSQYGIHTNDTGYAKLAGAFEQSIDRQLRGGGLGTWLTDAAGGVHTVGNAVSYGSLAGMPLNKPIVAMAPTNDGKGYWLVASDGGVFAFGDAGFFGSTGSLHLNAPIVGFTPTNNDQGYWLVASDGGVFAFGNATFLGSMGGHPLNKPVVGIAQTGSDRGYWLVASDGGIFSFGDAAFLGSTGSLKLNKPVVGMARSIDGNGYWLVASDGGVFSYGDAVFHGSTGSLVLNRPIVGMTVAPNGYGYTMGASDGGVFTFGSAVFNGSLGANPPAAPVVAIAST